MVSGRYADALFASVGADDKVLEDLKNIVTYYKNNEEFKEVFNNPRIKKDAKLEIVKEISSKNEKLINFIKLLLNENRFNIIEKIYKDYEDKINKQKGKETIKIISACELKQDEIKKIAEKYKKDNKLKEIEVESAVDSSLIGGMKLIAQGKIYDNSLQTKLDSML